MNYLVWDWIKFAIFSARNKNEYGFRTFWIMLFNWWFLNILVKYTTVKAFYTSRISFTLPLAAQFPLRKLIVCIVARRRVGDYLSSVPNSIANERGKECLTTLFHFKVEVPVCRKCALDVHTSGCKDDLMPLPLLCKELSPAGDSVNHSESTSYKGANGKKSSPNWAFQNSTFSELPWFLC